MPEDKNESLMFIHSSPSEDMQLSSGVTLPNGDIAYIRRDGNAICVRDGWYTLEKKSTFGETKNTIVKLISTADHLISVTHLRNKASSVIRYWNKVTRITSPYLIRHLQLLSNDHLAIGSESTLEIFDVHRNRSVQQWELPNAIIRQCIVDKLDNILLLLEWGDKNTVRLYSRDNKTYHTLKQLPKGSGHLLVLADGRCVIQYYPPPYLAKAGTAIDLLTFDAKDETYTLTSTSYLSEKKLAPGIVLPSGNLLFWQHGNATALFEWNATHPKTSKQLHLPIKKWIRHVIAIHKDNLLLTCNERDEMITHSITTTHHHKAMAAKKIMLDVVPEMPTILSDMIIEYGFWALKRVKTTVPANENILGAKDYGKHV